MQIPFSAVLLAGGKSTRMGRNKALLEVDGELLWQRQLRILQELQPNETLLADRNELLDAQENAGPLAGLVAAFRRCTTPLLLALAVDLPKMTATYLSHLLARCSQEHGLIPRMRDRFEPLAAVYPLSGRTIAERRLADGNYSLQNFAQQCLDGGLLQEIAVAPAEESLFFNMNTPADLFALQTEIVRVGTDLVETRSDEVAVEEPLEIRIEGHSVAVVMRTPGHDRELAAGFLLTEALIHSPNDIFEITTCGGDNIINVTLRDPRVFDPARLTRNIFSSSSCGICSKATIDAVRQEFPPTRSDVTVSIDTLRALPTRLRQPTFARTGGLHACALFNANGELQDLREDVGRHNALDKLIGRALLDEQLPLSDRILFLSGRVSFEMAQKALAAGIPIVAAISAPTSLAVEFARENNQTLVGFVRGETMNIYAGAERVAF